MTTLHWKLALGAALACAGALVLRTGSAFDHLDAPSARLDSAADITDVYAFMSPDPAAAGHLVLVMNVNPVATKTTALAEGIDYVFRVREVADVSAMTLKPADLDVTCRVASSRVTCTGPKGLTRSVALGEVTGAATDDMRVFAGPRSDPAFVDLDAVRATLASGAPKFSDAGKNALEGKDVVSLVVEIDVKEAFRANDGGADAGRSPTLTIAAETIRTGSGS
jgi:hypothetical protein